MAYDCDGLLTPTWFLAEVVRALPPAIVTDIAVTWEWQPGSHETWRSPSVSSEPPVLIRLTYPYWSLVRQLPIGPAIAIAHALADDRDLARGWA